MSLGHGASIVRNGLVLHLDAANVKSYPGSGNIWYDLSSNKNNVTLFNSPAYTSGYLSFGVNTYGVTQNNLDLTSTDKITIIVVTRTTTTTLKMILEHSVGAGSRNAFWVLMGPDSSGTTPSGSMEFADHNTSYNIAHTSTLLNNGQWSYVAVTSDRSKTATDQNSMYLNGALNSVNNTGTYSNDLTGNYDSFPLYIGARAGVSLFYLGDISNIMIYNRVLSEYELNQNFAAMKGRYGI